MELFLLSFPIILTCLVAIFHPFLPIGLIIFEFILRIYLTYFISLTYIIIMSYEIIKSFNESITFLFFVNLIYMFNFMNGFVFIPIIIDESSCIFLNQLMFITFLSCNILSIMYIYKNNYVQLKNVIDRQYFQPYLEDSDTSDNDDIITK